jgi:RNA polymerase sigma factor (TIGR02999 family)
VTVSPDVTQILLRIASDRLPAAEGLGLIYPAVYQELKRRAAALMRDQRDGHTLTPTALVHESFLKLVRPGDVRSESRAQFMAVASQAMRHILVDHARRKAAQKRGKSWHRVGLVEEIPDGRATAFEVLDLHEALEDLAQKDSRMAGVVEMRVFGGLAIREIAEALGVSTRTVDTDWKVAKAWLADRIGSPEEA